MPCTGYTWAWRTPGGITFTGKDRTALNAFRLPCGQCMGCRLDHARDWATRLHHENQLHEVSCFLTLTYSNDHMPDDYSVSKRAMQLFMKRLRKSLGDQAIRFFLCGEYGGITFRPHYHALIFGHDFGHDRTLWGKSRAGYLTYKSPSLETLWPYGLCDIGQVTTQSAGYVARYMTKKVYGSQADDHYTRLHPGTGQLLRVSPEFILMSTRPGIGYGWYEKWGSDAFPSDFIIIDGRRRPVPRYYFKKLSEDLQAEIKALRIKRAAAHADNNTIRRLMIREEALLLRIKNLTRNMENDQ